MEQTKESKRIIGGKMYVINIKSRYEQTPQKYVKLFEQLYAKDPLILLHSNRYISIKQLLKSEYLEDDGTPRMLLIKLISYDILNPDAFYDKKTKTQVKIDINPDIVANLKEVELYFIPKVHRLIVSISSKIGINQVMKYLTHSFAETASNGAVDINIKKSRDIITRVLNAHKIFLIDADITFSNKDFTEGFIAKFDKKIKDARPRNVKFKMEGTDEEPLKKEEDGIIEAIVNMSRSNGTMIARVQEKENGKPIKIDTKDYPMRIEIKDTEKNYFNKIYTELCSIFGHNQ